MLVTECSMASNIADPHPEVEFLGPCNMCRYMKKITLEKVLWSLHSMTGQVEVDPDIAALVLAPRPVLMISPDLLGQGASSA